ncbi:hypothetical protein ACFC9E_01145 [Enterococcus faecium]|uniref:hypothetical protein n=1 Tax=Enterococcus faecium TaxID=1352 RepID=UPI0039A4D1CF
MSFIEFNGKKSNDFNLILEPNLTFNSPSRSMEFEKIAGKDGEVAVGDGTFSNGTKSFPFNLLPQKNSSVEKISTEISNWLKKDSLWHDLYFDGEPEYVYQALHYEEYDLERVLSHYGKCVLKFTIKPYKFLKTGLVETSLPSSFSNKTNRNARPKITVRGSGDITIKIGNQSLNLKGVDEGIIIDSLYETVTSLDGKRPLWSKVTSYPLPVIEPGTQIVIVSGTTTDIKVVPRWEVVV